MPIKPPLTASANDTTHQVETEPSGDIPHLLDHIRTAIGRESWTWGRYVLRSPLTIWYNLLFNVVEALTTCVSRPCGLGLPHFNRIVEEILLEAPGMGTTSTLTRFPNAIKFKGLETYNSNSTK